MDEERKMGKSNGTGGGKNYDRVDGQDVAHASMKQNTDVINTMHHSVPVLDGNIAKFFIVLKINHDEMLKPDALL